MNIEFSFSPDSETWYFHWSFSENHFPGQPVQYYDTGQVPLSLQHQPNNFEEEALQPYPQYREGKYTF